MSMPTPRPADYAAGRAIGLRVGLIGLPLAAVNVLALSIVNNDQPALGQVASGPRVGDSALAATTDAWLILLCLAGALAARRTGFMQAAVVAGFIASLLDVVIYLVFALIWGLLYPSSVKPEGGHGLGGFNPYVPTNVHTVAAKIVDSLFFSGLVALLAGACCGFLGGAIGLLLRRLQRSRASALRRSD